MSKQSCFKPSFLLGLSLLLAGLISSASEDTKKLTVNPSVKVVPSSAIPARREFPLNTNVDPCQDFQSYVCSNAEAGFKLRDDRRSHTFSFNDSSERILEEKKKFFKQLAHPNAEFKKLLKDPRVAQLDTNYQGCMNATLGKKEELSFLNEIRTELAKIKSVDQLHLLEDSFNARGYSGFIADFPSENLDDPSKYDVLLYTSLMSLSDHDYYDKPELVNDYVQIMKSYFKILDPKLTEAEALAKSQKLMDLEKEFIKVFPRSAERRQRWDQKRYFTYGDALGKFPNLKLDKKFAEFTAKNSLRIPIPEALEFLNAKLVEGNLDLFKDLLAVSWGMGVIDDSNHGFFDQRFQFQKKYFGGPTKRAPRDERCTKAIMGTFGKEIDWVLVDKMFPNFPEQIFIDDANKIRQAIITGLEKNHWLSKTSKEGALKKMKSARLQLVKPKTDAEWDFQPLVKYSKNTPMKNGEALAKANHEKYLLKLQKPVDRDIWGMSPLTVNAYYDPSQNKFVMPIGILQYPFFDGNLSLAENLGAVGAVIGHELGHGIDDQGSKYDSDGKLLEWMTEKDRLELGRRGSKLVEQFNKTGHNGQLTLGENIGDLVGLTFAYNAAFPNQQGSVEEKKKLFIAYARLWCNVTRPQFQELMLKTDPHALGHSRINEQVKHQPGFAEAFQCKSGSPMTLPEKDRVVIW